MNPSDKPSDKQSACLQRLVRLLFSYEIKVRIACVIWFVGLLVIGAHADSNLTKWICFIFAVPPMTLAQLDSEIWRRVFRLPNVKVRDAASDPRPLDTSRE